MDSGLLQQVFGFPLLFLQAESLKTPTLSVLQACDITGGLYLKIPQKVALAQYLLVNSFCLPSTSSPRLCPEVLTVVFSTVGVPA